jgi:hypothetical protein
MSLMRLDGTCCPRIPPVFTSSRVVPAYGRSRMLLTTWRAIGPRVPSQHLGHSGVLRCPSTTRG